MIKYDPNMNIVYTLCYSTAKKHIITCLYPHYCLRCRGSEWEKMSFFALNIQNGVKSKNFEDFIFQICFPAQAAFFGFLWLFFRIQSCKYGETYLKKVFVVFSTKMKSFRKKYFFRKFLPRGQDIQVLILSFLHRFQKLIS